MFVTSGRRRPLGRTISHVALVLSIAFGTLAGAGGYWAVIKAPELVRSPNGGLRLEQVRLAVSQRGLTCLEVERPGRHLLGQHAVRLCELVELDAQLRQSLQGGLHFLRQASLTIDRHLHACARHKFRQGAGIVVAIGVVARITVARPRYTLQCVPVNSLRSE